MGRLALSDAAIVRDLFGLLNPKYTVLIDAIFREIDAQVTYAQQRRHNSQRHYSK